MNAIDAVIEATVRKEGGYVNHPSDRGGATMWGVTEQVARSYGYHGPMQSLKIEQAMDIYKERYFIQPGFLGVATLMADLAQELFDCGVNMGPKVACEFLQRLLNVCNQRANRYPDIAVDGRIGPMTLHSLATLKNYRGKGTEAVLIKGVKALRGAKYIGIAEANKSQEDFVWGWLANRV